MSLRKSITAAAVLTATALALAGCNASGPSNAGATAPTILRVGVNQEAKSFDPAELPSSPGQSVQFWSPVYDTLLLRSPDGKVVPNMADWKYNEDQTVLTLALRDDLKFADGTPIKAGAVVQSMDRFRNGTGPDHVYLAGVTSLQASDDSTVVLSLNKPDPGLLFKLTSTSGAIANPAGFDQDVATDPPSSGAYVLDAKRTTPGVQYTYTRNPNYWNPQGWPFEEIQLKILLDQTARTNALRSGQVDVTTLDAQSVAEIEAQTGYGVTKQSSAWEGMFIWDRDGKKVPALADPRVRQAMNLAFDRESIAKFLMLGNVEVNSQIFREGTSAYYDGHEYGYDVERAKGLMAAAGYAAGFELVIPSIATQAYLEPTIVDSLANIGITVKVESVPAEQVTGRVLKGEYAAGSYRYTQDAAWIDFTRHVTPNAPTNPFHNETPELNALLDAAQKATSEKRDVAEKAVGAYLFENAWFLPLFNAAQLMGHTDTVKVTPQVGVNILPLQNYSPAK